MTTIALSALSLGAAVPTALAATDVAGVVKGFVDSDVVYEATQTANDRDLFPGVPADTIMVVTPGTDDGTLIARNLPLVGNRQTLIVNYPQSFGPVIAGPSGGLSVLAPGYDASKTIASDQNLRLMTALAELGGDRPFVIYTGYSQGADALGDAVEKAYAEGLLDPATSKIVLVSDPRSPWGIKAWLAQVPVLPQLVELLGIESNGPRDPAATGDLDVTSVIIVGDPVSNFQWVWFRPATSAAVNIAGFLTIHSGNGSQTFGDLDELGDPTLLTSGNTTYAVYDAAHPFALLLQVIHDELGIPYTDDDLDRWDRLAEAYFETQAPAAGTAAPGIPVSTAPPAASPTTPVSSPSDNYTVTVPSAVATGAAPAPQPAEPESSAAPTPAPVEVPTGADAEDETDGQPAAPDSDTEPSANPVDAAPADDPDEAVAPPESSTPTTATGNSDADAPN